MTAAGLASLFIAQDYLRANEAKCAGNVTDERIEMGLKWLGDNFNPKWSDGYLLYGIERVGVASGYKYFGKHDWYALGAETLVKAQDKDGSWKYGEKGEVRVPGTAFGIFFLARGRAPVVINKLRYEFEAAPASASPGNRKTKDAGGARWNQRPRDVANVVRWMGETMERDLNWQVVNLSVNPADLLDAPVLYLSGDQALRLGPDDKHKLRSYVEQGGLILAQADCAKKPFATGFRELGKELFPAYEFRPLPASHPVFSEQYNASKWKDKIEVDGLSNGVRELMLLIPSEDVARSWQTRSTEQKAPHFQLMSNVLLYAVDKADLRFKGQTYVLTADPKAKPRRTIKLARLRYAQNWDPEPGGWRRFAIHLLNEYRLGLQIDTIDLGGKEGAAAPSLKGYDVAHLTGTTKFQFSQPARDVIGQFIDAGGTLIVDAAGGATPFADAADAELFKIFRADQKQLADPLKPAHPAYNLPVSKITTVTYRAFTRDQLGNLKTPRIRGITVANQKNRTAVFLSKEDLSTGLVGQSVDGVFGYAPNSATQLMTNLILYATNEGTRPATQPSTKPTTKPASKSESKSSKKAKPEKKDE
jgi:hypothetical protein